jgi:thiamine biosynthesis lipoprotein
MKRKIIQIGFLILLLLVIYVRISHEKSKPIKETRFALGTFVTIDIQERNRHNNEIIDSVFALIQTLEKQFSLTYPESETNKINLCKDSLRISDDMQDLLQIANKTSNETEGTFDVTVGKIIYMYDFVDEIMPSPEEIDSALFFVGHEKIICNDGNFIKGDPEIFIDLGGIAKGFIVDKAIQYLKEIGINYAAINAGGDLFVLRNPDTEIWKIGIQHPRNQSALFGTIEVINRAVVTSGDYEQYFIKGGKRIHHIIDPKTGMPSYNSVSVTVIAPNATTADALCTALFVTGPNLGIKLVDQKIDVEALIVFEQDGELCYIFSDNFDKFNFTLLDSTALFIKDLQ